MGGAGSEPDTTTLPVDARCDFFLVLASDGLWDKVDEQEAVDVARRLCSTDDITVLIVSFSAMRDQGLY